MFNDKMHTYIMFILSLQLFFSRYFTSLDTKSETFYLNTKFLYMHYAFFAIVRHRTAEYAAMEPNFEETQMNKI